ncbi:MAG TPA: gamma carbonic anhydrase family protein [Nannocystis exedens]|nr:gamma carbonic anhydrase family protein [Nannocystis exedens]
MIERFLGRSARLDPAAFVHVRATLIGEVVVGSGSSIWPGAVLRADDAPILIGESTSIQDGALVHATEGISATTVGSRVTVGHGAILHGCSVGDDCLIGMGSIILDNAVVESKAFVGAGALVPPNKVVRSGELWLGNPAKRVRTLGAEDYAWIEHSWRAYVRRSRQYLAERTGG